MQYKYFKRNLRKYRGESISYNLVYRIPVEHTETTPVWAEFTATLAPHPNYGKWKLSKEMFATGELNPRRRKKWKAIPISDSEAMLMLL